MGFFKNWFNLRYHKPSSREIRYEKAQQELDRVMQILKDQDTARLVSTEEIHELTKDQIPNLKVGDKLVAKESANGIYRVTKGGTQVEVLRVIPREEALQERCGVDDFPRDFEVLLTDGISFNVAKCNSKFFERVQ
jgi:hypothetical protein